MSPAGESPRERPVRVLLVEDDELVRMLIHGALERTGLAVVEAASGREAIRLFFDERADVVVTDLGMRGGDGAWLIAELRACESNVPVVAISGGVLVVDESPTEAAERIGVAAVLEKPFGMDDLVAVIRRVSATVG